MVTGSGGAKSGTLLVFVTTNPADSAEVADWLRPQLATDEVTVANGFYAGVAALAAGSRAIVLNVGPPDGQDSWRLAELRHRGVPSSTEEVAYVVVADATVLPQLSGVLRTDLAVTSVGRLPPLRELLVSEEPLVDDQTIWRRTMR
ncbi:MAG: hypothetical protein QOC82_1383 [Frankiaceae bacterium]|jgi:hypothetical protein|nr:hypothetical protein [Frankiaceae bacterium]